MPGREIKDKNIQERIYDVTRQIPYGKVATYGQIAHITGGCTARMVGYAMAAIKSDDIPWQRVINAKGKISPHGLGYGSAVQRQRLEDEGVEFDKLDRIDFSRFGWLPE
ncbi:MAG: MGMT family protein [Anaerolineaceae bacterium]|nr:MGMT family protein [Anaerolineaceae bacterium]